MEETSTVLKSDVLGRVRIAKDHREALLDAFERTGVSGSAFARHHGVNYQTFASWLQKRKKERGSYSRGTGTDGPVQPLRLSLAEVELPAPKLPTIVSAPVSLAEIVLPGGLAVHVRAGADVAFIAKLVSALRSC